MRYLQVLLATLAVGACTATSLAVARPAFDYPMAAAATCAARDVTPSISWHISDETDRPELSRWCRAVGAPVYVAQPDVAPTDLPTLQEFVVMSWNAHLAEGELDELLAKLRSGALTNGRPVAHFALLIQELYRNGDAVPAFDVRDRSAFAIKPSNPDTLDIDDHAARLGLSILYVPSMRNGPELREDRGSAIISTEPLLDPLALELPLARQRRVTLGAAITIQTPDGLRELQLVNAHLEPLSSPKTLWVFKNPRSRQVQAILELLGTTRFTDPAVAGVVLGGDFNTVRSGAGESAYRLARAWSQGMAGEDPRDTHLMGRLDYLFFKLENGWSGSTRRLDERFGSDHYPVIGTFLKR